MSLNNSPSRVQSNVAHQAIDDYSISDETIYIVTALVFACLITTIFGLLGVSWLLPAIQTIVLTVFMLPLLRRGKLRRAIVLLLSWLLIQFVIMLFLSMAVPSRMETTISDGFNRRTEMLAWFYAFDAPPDGLVSSIGSRLLETISIVVGSLVTAGLIGFWLLIRGVNLAAFYAGTVLGALSDTANGIGAFPLWTELRLIGYIILSPIFAGLLLNKQGSIWVYLQRWRLYLLAATILIILGLIVENSMSDLWRTWFS